MPFSIHPVRFQGLWRGPLRWGDFCELGNLRCFPVLRSVTFNAEPVQRSLGRSPRPRSLGGWLV